MKINKELLINMLDHQSKSNDLYKPGSYWQNKTKNATNRIIKFGLNDFRSHRSLIGLSFADNPILDIRSFWDSGLRLVFIRLLIFFVPFKKIFLGQLKFTQNLFDQNKILKRQIFTKSKLYSDSRFKIPENSTKGGCEDFVEIKGKKISSIYIKILSELKVVSSKIDYTKGKSFLEIGSGFGVLPHLMIENFPNIKKIVVVDIAPNLYISNMYLQSFYGDSVRSFDSFPIGEKIKFKEDDSLEIYFLLPDQILELDIKFDYFNNSHSFIEMPSEIVANYAHKVQLLLNEGSRVSMLSYKSTRDDTLDPNNLPAFFNNLDFNTFEDSDIFGDEFMLHVSK
ncbi:putative sugar O-methyltransferase [Flavobacteriaceae bacterium]|nr:putative sugar O-methyltransferase [Flavobacteriaceae bacterium]